MLIALVVGELTNNSLKYGALRNRNSVSLSWTIDAGLLLFTGGRISARETETRFARGATARAIQ